jgi:hypothetical protein
VPEVLTMKWRRFMSVFYFLISPVL